MFGGKFSFKKKSEINIEDIFLDHLLEKQNRSSKSSFGKLEVPLRRFIFPAFFISVLILSSFLLFICFKMQVIDSKKYQVLAEKNKIVFLETKAQRGVIYDSDFHQLVWNDFDFDLVLEPNLLPKDQEIKHKVFKEVSEILPMSAEAIEEKIRRQENQKKTLVIYPHLSYQNMVLLETNIEKFPGFELRKSTSRRYLDSETLSHLLGYLGKVSSEELKDDSYYSPQDYIGKEGLEKSYEAVLREKKGKIEIERDAKGKEISKKVLKAPRPGENLVLFLNLGLQKEATEALKQTLKETGTSKGAVVAINPANGGILASVSYPGFNNNLFAQGITEKDLKSLNENSANPQLNRVIAGLYPAGSTIKPFVALSALEEHIITPETKLYCPLNLCLENIYTHTQKCFSDWKYHGWTSVKKAIAESVNPFFYMIGGGYVRPKSADARLPKKFQGLGVEKIKNYLEKFGFGKKTNIDLPGEMAGRVPDPAWRKSYFKSPQMQEWHIGHTYNLSIGQGDFLTTPLELAAAYQVIANNGTLYQPIMVEKIVNVKKETIKEFSPKVLRKNFISSTALKTVKEGMLQSVTSPSGSAHKMLGDLPFTVAAKTGTAQTHIKNLFDNWVVAFAPYEHPKIILVVLIENVKGMRIAALSTARRILKWYFLQENVDETGPLN